MGTRGKVDNVQTTPAVSQVTTPEPTPKKAGKLESQIADYFQKQANIDINQYRDDTTRRFDKKNQINIDFKSMPKTVQQNFVHAMNAKYSPFVMTDLGAWGKTITRKK